MVNYRNLLALEWDGQCTFTLVPKAWTFVFCQFTSNPSLLYYTLMKLIILLTVSSTINQYITAYTTLCTFTAYASCGWL